METLLTSRNLSTTFSPTYCQSWTIILLFDEINKMIRECRETYLAQNSKSDTDVTQTQNQDSNKRPI